MRTSQDVVFVESHPFYPCAIIDASPASLVNLLSFLFFPDAPPASLPISHSILPTSVSSSESSLVVLDYTVRPHVTQVYSCRGAHLLDASSAELSSDVSSSPPVEPSSLVGSSPEQLLGRDHRPRMPPNCYSPSAFTATALFEPHFYHDAILHPEWKHTMVEEIATLERTGTRDLMPCPPHARLITCKWVYKVKTRSDGSLECYKAHLVARGFQQEHGRNYDETFAHVAHMTTIHTLLVVASVREWSISQLDLKNAFLNGELREDVYMRPPPRYYVPGGMVCHFRRSLYGLNQASRAWF
jgi:hypothetical protein